MCKVVKKEKETKSSQETENKKPGKIHDAFFRSSMADLTVAKEFFLTYLPKDILKNNKKIKYKNIIHNEKVAKVSVVGAGMVSTPGVTYKMFRGLADDKINILAISTSEIKLSVIIDEENTLKAVKKLHTIFELD